MRILCDIGGTHIRMAGDDGGDQPVNPCKFAVSDFADLYDAVQAYCKQHGIAAVNSVAVAAAANDHGDGIYRFGNNEGWVIDPVALRARGMVLEPVMNDFAASAWGMTRLPDDCVVVARAGVRDDAAPRAILGPGTGLGLAYALPLDSLGSRGRWRVQETHGGHMVAQTFTPEHRAIYDLVATIGGYDRMIVVEDLVSGRALPVVYRAVCQMRGISPAPILHAAELLDMADDAAVVDTLRLFHEFLGLFMHNVATMLSAYGGLYLDGGMVARLQERGLFDVARTLKFMTIDPVVPVRRDLERTPVLIVNDPYIALRGLIAVNRSANTKE